MNRCRAFFVLLAFLAPTGCTAPNGEPAEEEASSRDVAQEPATVTPDAGTHPRKPWEIGKDLRACLDELSPLMRDVPPEVALLEVPPGQNSNSRPLLFETVALLRAGLEIPATERDFTGDTQGSLGMLLARATPRDELQVWTLQLAQYLEAVRVEWRKLRLRVGDECSWLQEYDRILTRCEELIAEAATLPGPEKPVD